MGRTADRSYVEEFLRGKGWWPGLDEPREQLKLKQTELQKVEDGMKEVELALGAIK